MLKSYNYLDTMQHTKAFERAQSKAVMWYEIGQNLGVDDGFLDDVKHRVSSGVEDSKKKLDDVLNEWIESKCSPVTPENLDSVLEKVHSAMVIRYIFE